MGVTGRTASGGGVHMYINTKFDTDCLFSMPYPLLLYNSDSSIRYANQLFCAYTGRTLNEIHNMKPPFPWFVKIETPLIQNCPDQAMNLSESLRIARKHFMSTTKFVVQGRDAESHHIFELQHYYLEPSNESPFYVEVWRDVTELDNLRKDYRFYIGEVTRAQENERLRLATELHDTTLQDLAVICTEIDDIKAKRKDVAFQDDLDSLRDKVQYVSQSLRHLLNFLRPVALKDYGLVASVVSLVKDLESVDAKNDRQIDYKIKVRGQEIRLDEDREMQVFRIVQEAARNIRKHSNARLAAISFNYTATKLSIEIVDDGQGFSTSGTKEMEVRKYSKAGKFGLLNIRERARILGAQVKITSGIGAGTRLYLSVPIGSE
jgi:signal transduction histidine kinase